MRQAHPLRQYLSLALLLMPGLGFGIWAWIYRRALGWEHLFSPPWQFLGIGFFGLIATLGGVLDWRYHRNPLKLQLSHKERDAEAAALGLGGLPLFILMCLATLSAQPNYYLIPILLVLVYTVVAICYDEFVFHRLRCGKTEQFYHRMLVFGNLLAWLCWIHFIYYP